MSYWGNDFFLLFATGLQALVDTGFKGCELLATCILSHVTH